MNVTERLLLPEKYFGFDSVGQLSVYSLYRDDSIGKVKSIIERKERS